MLSTPKAVTALLVLLALGSVAPSVDAADPESEKDKTLYALGMALAAKVPAFEPTDEELAMIQSGIADRLRGKTPKVDMVAFGPKLDPFIRDRLAEVAVKEKERGEAFRAKLAAEEGAETTDSGLIYFEIEPGTGESPTPTDTVKIHYHGTLEDGTVFDSSVDRGEPAQFALNAVVPCFSEGVSKMKVGGKAKIVCPPDLAYGDVGQGGIKPGATLVFELELLEIVKPATGTNPTP
jgi:FKBP-type peptidyl-prolyl cis-trans isomerase